MAILLRQKVGGEKRQANPVGGRSQDFCADLPESVREVHAPAVQRNRFQNHVPGFPFGEWFRDDEHRHAGRVVRPLDKGQARDHLGRCGRRELGPPRAGAGATVEREHAQVAA